MATSWLAPALVALVLLTSASHVGAHIGGVILAEKFGLWDALPALEIPSDINVLLKEWAQPLGAAFDGRWLSDLPQALPALEIPSDVKLRLKAWARALEPVFDQSLRALWQPPEEKGRLVWLEAQLRRVEALLEIEESAHLDCAKGKLQLSLDMASLNKTLLRSIESERTSQRQSLLLRKKVALEASKLAKCSSSLEQSTAELKELQAALSAAHSNLRSLSEGLSVSRADAAETQQKIGVLEVENLRLSEKIQALESVKQQLWLVCCAIICLALCLGASRAVMVLNDKLPWKSVRRPKTGDKTSRAKGKKRRSRK